MIIDPYRWSSALGSGATPTYVSASGAGFTFATTCFWPTHALNDIAIFAVVGARGNSPAMPSGFTQFATFATSAVTDDCRVTLGWKRTSAAESNFTYSGPGGSAYYYTALIIVRGCYLAASPIAACVGNGQDGPSTSISWPTASSAEQNPFVLLIGARGNNASTPAFSGYATGNLVGAAERLDSGLSSSDGGGVVVVTGSVVGGDVTGTLSGACTANTSFAVATVLLFG